MLDTDLEPEVAEAGREVPAPSPVERPVRKIIHVDMRCKGKNTCAFGRSAAADINCRSLACKRVIAYSQPLRH